MTEIGETIVDNQQPDIEPEKITADKEEFQVYSHLEIISLLRSLKRNHVQVTIYFEQGEDFLLTSILAVNPDFEEVVLDAGRDEGVNKRLCASSPITLVAFLDQIKLQFECPRAGMTALDGHPAIRVRLPTSILRLQRRDNYRAPAPVAAPLQCQIPSTAHPGEVSSIRIADISCGGVSLVSRPESLKYDPATVLNGCRIELPQVATIEVNLEVRHTNDYIDAGGRTARRCGCRFIALSGPDATLIQRYINLLDLERRNTL
jgi:c-di-GMP-binding flagellar brake protein YcgR